MHKHPGEFHITEIQNIHLHKEVDEGNDPKPMDLSHTKSVHYPDCQQLILWLPNPGRNYGKIKIFKNSSDPAFFESEVTDILNGSIQLLFDTLPFEPGSYIFYIEMPGQIKHILYGQKYEPTEIQKPEIPQIQEQTTEDRPPIRYHDSYGNHIEDDIDFREKAIHAMLQKLNRKIEYEESGRSGNIYYIDGDFKLKLYYEFGAGDCIVYIDIPTEKQWQARTGLEPESREEIIQFIADQVQKDKCASARIEITDQYISYYTK